MIKINKCECCNKPAPLAYVDKDNYDDEQRIKKGLKPWNSRPLEFYYFRYMVDLSLWLKIKKSPKGILCLYCLAKKLKKKINKKKFTLKDFPNRICHKTGIIYSTLNFSLARRRELVKYANSGKNTSLIF